MDDFKIVIDKPIDVSTVAIVKINIINKKIKIELYTADKIEKFRKSITQNSSQNSNKFIKFDNEIINTKKFNHKYKLKKSNHTLDILFTIFLTLKCYNKCIFFYLIYI